MRRAQRSLYVQKHHPLCIRATSPLAVESTSPITSTAKKPGLWSNLQSSNQMVMPCHTDANEAGVRRGKVAKVRRRMQKIVLVNATLSWVVTGLGYVIVSQKQNQALKDVLLCEAIKAVVSVLSLIQVFLVILYRNYSLSYQEAVRLALLLSPMPIKRLRKSPKHIAQSTCECLLHIITMVPNFDQPVSYHFLGISLDTLLFLLLLLRNYHTVQMLYWWSRFSDLRTHHYAKIANLDVSSKFVVRCVLAANGARVVFFFYAVMVAISGLFQYAIDMESATRGNNTWDKIWEVTATQVTIGYGDGAPVTFFGQLTMVISCFCGIGILGFGNIISQSYLGLGLKECEMTSELLYMRAKQGNRLEAARILQRWWRLMKMRMMKSKQSQTIVGFYAYLLTFRQTLAACRQVKAHRFEGQIAAFDTAIHKQFRFLNEYMSPVKDVHTLLPDLLRNQYKILTATQSLLQPSQSAMPGGESSRYSSTHPGERSCRTKGTTRKRIVQSNQGFAKACLSALQRRKSRLARTAIVPRTPVSLGS